MGSMTFFPWKLPKFLLLMVQMLGCQNAQIQKVQVKVKMKSASVFTKMHVCVCVCVTALDLFISYSGLSSGLYLHLVV